MRRFLHVVFAVLFAILALSVEGCTEPVRPAIEVTPGTSTLVSGQTVQLLVQRQFPGGPIENMTERVTYASSNRSIATVSGTGLVTAGSVGGNVVIRVTDHANDASATTTISVEGPRIVGIDIIPTRPVVSLRTGEKIKLTATARLNDGTTREVTNQVLWASSNLAAATVGVTPLDSGLVTGVAQGETTITATDSVTLLQGRAVVLVSGEAELVALRIDPNPASVVVGTTLQLTATGVFADGATRDLTKTVAWTSSATQFATVDASGLLTGVAAGSTTLTAERTSPAPIRGSAAVTVTTP
jgi:uncharacterized protein YjdB